MYDQADIYCEKLGAWQDNDRVVLVKDYNLHMRGKMNAWNYVWMYFWISLFNF